jgi:hypothetical protein
MRIGRKWVPKNGFNAIRSDMCDIRAATLGLKSHSLDNTVKGILDKTENATWQKKKYYTTHAH